ncbi:MAG: hypothetical protein ABI411_21490 [Tahibacter sp.]
MSKLVVEEKADGFHWRIILFGRDTPLTSPSFESWDAAVDDAFRFRQAITLAPVVNSAGAIIDAPLVIGAPPDML